MVTPELRLKRDKLHATVQELGSVAVAFSGGVDSTLLVAVCASALPPGKFLAITARSQLTPGDEIERARETAVALGVPLRVVDLDVLGCEEVADNPPDRCYHCKRLIFARLWEVARAKGLEHLVHGANLDDQGDFRPGMQAAAELGARAPLLDAGFTKSDVRELSREMGLPTWDLPSSACLASRVPYNRRLTGEILARVGAAEAAIRTLTSVSDLRVRDHFPVARVEVPAVQLQALVEVGLRERIVDSLRALGYHYVTLDLAGFRSGSLNDAILDAQPTVQGEQQE